MEEKLIVKLVGEQGGLKYDLGRVTRVGRAADCEVRIEDAKVSRQHARIVVDGADVRLEDLGSTNGTYLNGRRVAGSAALRDGDRVRVHESEFTLCITPARTEPDDGPTPPTMGDDASDDALAIPPATVDNATDSHPAPPPAMAGESSDDAPDPPPASAADMFDDVPDPPLATADDASPPSAADRSTPADDPYVPGSWVSTDDARGTRLLDSDAKHQFLVNLRGKLDELPTSTKPHLVLIVNDQVAETFELADDSDAKEVWTIGRDDGCEVALGDPTVSGQHAQLFHQDGRWRLVNLVSANGTSVNGEKCLTAYLSDGDQIDVGLAQLVFRTGMQQANAERSQSSQSTLFAKLRNWVGRRV